MVCVNCAAIPEELIESELFGHEKGAFTGADKARRGKFELADKGTLFLDEIGDMSLKTQAKVLRVLQERRLERVGGSKTVEVDVRVIAATNRKPEDAIKEGKLREDLYYRLQVLPIEIPPLRDRPEDILPLARHFIHIYSRRYGKEVKGLSKDAERILLSHSWPGNVRELKNLVEMLVVVKGEGIIGVPDLPPKIRKASSMGVEGKAPQALETKTAQLPEEGIDLTTAVTEFEKALILESLNRTGWVKQQAAKLLNLNRTTLVEKIKRYNLEKMAVGQ
jgi:transcriptional regulator with PAS, ATPase and Fis domain